MQHQLYQRLRRELDQTVHPRDCCSKLASLGLLNGSAAAEKNHSTAEDASASPRPLPLSRRASTASHDDLSLCLDGLVSCHVSPCLCHKCILAGLGGFASTLACESQMHIKL
jgi:hypothetical protein